MMALTPESPLNMEITVGDYNTIIEGLASLAYGRVSDLMERLKAQAQIQVFQIQRENGELRQVGGTTFVPEPYGEAPLTPEGSVDEVQQ